MRLSILCLEETEIKHLVNIIFVSVCIGHSIYGLVRFDIFPGLVLSVLWRLKPLQTI